MPVELTGLIAWLIRVTLDGIGSFPLDSPIDASSSITIQLLVGFLGSHSGLLPMSLKRNISIRFHKDALQ